MNQTTTSSAKRIARLLLAVACTAALAATAFALTGCGGNKKQEGQIDPNTLKELVVGFDASYPPYGFTNDKGEYTGFDIDLAREVCKRRGWECKLSAIDWDAKDALIDSGAITCIWNGFTMEGRENAFTFSRPYMLNKQVIVVKADSPIKDDKDLAGKVVVTQTDSAALDVLQGDKKELAATFKQLEQIGDYNVAFRQLEAGAADAVACDSSIAAYWMAAKPDTYRVLEPALSSENYAVGFKKGNVQLADAVTETLLQMYEDGTVAQIAQKYEKYGLSMQNWILK